MSDASSRTLLSLWGIKEAPPEHCSGTDFGAEDDRLLNQSPALKSSSTREADSPQAAETRPNADISTKPIDRAKTASQWNSIFGKSKATNSQEVQQCDQRSEAAAPVNDDGKHYASESTLPPIDRRRQSDPTLVHTLKVPSEILANMQAQSRSESETLSKAVSEKPSWIHVLHAPPEKLKTIKPRIHSFFAKRATSSGPGVSKARRKDNSLRPIKLRHPTWSTVHVRPNITYDAKYAAPLPKRRRNYPGTDDTPDSDWKLVVRQLPTGSAYGARSCHTPKRALYSREQVRALAALSQSKRNGDFLSSLITFSGEPKPFDCGEFEDSMWCDKYAPKGPSYHLISTEAQKVADWASTQMQRRQKQRQRPLKRKRRNADDFVVEDEEEDEEDLDDILLVCGPCGSGKTSAVYAAAQSVNAFVFEVNCSTKRTGKELSSLLNGISRNHAVHNAKNCIILVDDGDVVYENEAGGFWATLARFTATSRRPVIVTCTDPNLIALTDVRTSIVRLHMPDLVRVTDTAWTIALSEGYVLSKTDVAALAVVTRGDLRRILAHLQFWCQMGIGGDPSGVDWYAKDFEFTQAHAQRVICEGSWCPPLGNEPEVDQAMPPPPRAPVPGSLDSHATAADNASEIDSAFEPFCIEYRAAAPEETVSGNGAMILTAWRVPAVSRPVLSYLNTGTASYLPKIRDIFADEYAFGTTLDSLIATDIAPYMREIAACDFRRALTMEQSLAQHQSARGMRMTRRMWAASGIDSRQYMGYSMSSLRLILSTCLPAKLFEPGEQQELASV